jgi:cytochrome P450
MVYNMAAHPQWQERAREESARLGDGPLDIEALEKLETLELIMNESLRMVTPLPFNMRQAVRDTELLGHYIPAGTNITIWPGMNHRLAELWTEPDKFDPARFAEPRSEHKNHGQLEVKTVVHRLLRRYRLELARPDYQPRYDYGGMPIPMDGMPIVLRPL